MSLKDTKTSKRPRLLMRLENSPDLLIEIEYLRSNYTTHQLNRVKSKSKRVRIKKILPSYDDKTLKAAPLLGLEPLPIAIGIRMNSPALSFD